MHPEGNILSTLAFFIWIPAAVWFAHKWPPAKAASLLLLVPLLVLPEKAAFYVPGLPAFDKNRIAILLLLVGVLLFHRYRLRSLQLGGSTKLAIATLLVGVVVTVSLNRDPISQGPVTLPGQTLSDIPRLLGASVLDNVLPFVLAASMFNTSRDLRVLFRSLVLAALLYSILVLVEISLSPQLHRWVYGYFQHSFRMTMRGGGYKPMVFMHSGLAVALFMALAAMAAAGLYKAKIGFLRSRRLWPVVYLAIVLAMCRSVAALLYTQTALVLILFTSAKTQFRFALLLALAVLLYPSLRSSGMVPTERLEEVARNQYGEGRALSLMTRLTNEQELLERADERFFFGWGHGCRACIFDPRSGRQTSIRDGDWIITIGEFGRVGFLAKYILLLLPIFVSARQWKRVRRRSYSRLLAALALIVGFSAFDLLPNGNFDYLVFALSGALLGTSTGAALEARQSRVRRQQSQAGGPRCHAAPGLLDPGANPATN